MQPREGWLSSRLGRLKTSEVAHRFGSAVIWGGLSSLLGRGGAILSMMLAARLLGANDFGKLTLLLGIALTFGVLVSAGLSVTCIKFVADYNRKDPARAGRIIDLANILTAIMSVIVGVSVVFFASFISTYVLNAPDLVVLVSWSAILIGVLASTAVQQGILIGLEAFRTSATIEFAFSFLILILLPLGAHLYGLEGAFAGMVFAYAFKLILMHWAVSKLMSEHNIHRSWSLVRTELPVLWSFSFPTLLNSLLMAPVTWAAMAIIAQETRGHEQIGIFNAANQWFSFMLFVPTMLNAVTFPLLTSKLASGAVGTTWRLFYTKLAGTVVFAVVAAIIVGFLSSWIMSFYGPMYASEALVLVIVAVTVVFASGVTPIGNLFIAYAKPWAWASSGIVWAITAILVVYYLREQGALGLALGFAAAYAMKLAVAVILLIGLNRESKEVKN